MTIMWVKKLLCKHTWERETLESWTGGTYYTRPKLKSKTHVFICPKCTKMIIRKIYI